jgi:hypothetical protein
MRRMLFSAIATQSETPLVGGDGSETGAKEAFDEAARTKGPGARTF